MKTAKITLILGGQRSGKSGYAEQLVEAEGCGLYLATAQAFDDEMNDRINTHKNRRGEMWSTLEEPFDIANIIDRESKVERPILVDCLTLWLSNLMMAERDISIETERLISVLQKCCCETTPRVCEQSCGDAHPMGPGRTYMES